MHMAEWITKLDAFLRLSERDILSHAGSVSHQAAVEKAHAEKTAGAGFEPKKALSYRRKVLLAWKAAAPTLFHRKLPSRFSAASENPRNCRRGFPRRVFAVFVESGRFRPS
jgi:hypothetical protein